MKKLLLLFILILPIYALAQPTGNILPPQLRMDTETKEIIDKDLKSEIQLAYPQLHDKELTANQKKFNSLINDFLAKELQQFKKDMAENQQYVAKMPKVIVKNTLFINYDADVLHPNNQIIISIRFKTEKYLAGSAHPSHQNSTLNYELTTGKILALNELFKPDSNYLAILSQASGKALSKLLPKEAILQDGYAPKAENFKNWSLRPDSLEIIFDEYQVAAYVYGAQNVMIPYSAFEADIAATSPIAACVKQACK